MPTSRAAQRRPLSLGPQQLQQYAEAWAEQVFQPLPGSQAPANGWAGRQTVAVILQTDDRDVVRSSRALKQRLSRHSEVRAAIAGVSRLIESGDLAAAREATLALTATDLPRVYWCSNAFELAARLADCLSHGEQCYESGPIEGPAGRVIWMSVWYDPSHPV